MAPAYSAENQLLSSIPCDAARENDPEGAPLPPAVDMGCPVFNSFTFTFQLKKWLRKVSISLQCDSRSETLSKIKLS